MARNRTGVVKTCLNCSKEFYVRPARAETALCCSTACLGEWKKATNTSTPRSVCPVCGNEIKMKKSARDKLKTPPTCSRKCRAEYLKTAYIAAANPNFRHHDSIEAVFSKRISSIRKRCEERKLPFDISSQWLADLYRSQNGLCHYTGVPMSLATSKWEGQADADVVSVDRVVPDKGYVKDNVVLCCNAINKMKGASSLEELQWLFSYIQAKQSQTCGLQVKLLRPEARIPTRARLGDAGFDVVAAKVEDDGKFVKVFTGIAIAPDPGWFVQLYPRSSIFKKDLMLANSVGVLDNGYRGEVVAIFKKLGDQTIEIGERVAQLIPGRLAGAEIKLVEDLSDTERGTGGFGSTGVK